MHFVFEEGIVKTDYWFENLIVCVPFSDVYNYIITIQIFKKEVSCSSVFIL